MKNFIIVALLVLFAFNNFSLTQTSGAIVGFTENKVFPFFQSAGDKIEVLYAKVTDMDSEEGTLKAEGENWFAGLGFFFSELKGDISEGFKETKDKVVEEIKL